MKNKLLLTILVTFGIKILCAQVSIQTASTSSLVCPGNPVKYEVVPSATYIICSVTWTKTGTGNYQSGSSAISNPSTVVWSDQKPNKVTMQATVNYRTTSGLCSSPEVMTLTVTHVLRSVYEEPLTGVISPRDIAYCATSQAQVVNITIAQMNIKNTGPGTAIPTTPVERYMWTLPTGWRQAGTTNSGTIYTISPAISVEPANPSSNCSSSGSVLVSAVAGGFTQCTGLNYSLSRESKIVLNRTPTFTLTPEAGFVAQTCGRTASVVFTATAIPCASTYTWTYTEGWNGPASTTTNTVSASPVKPDGSTVNARASITVNANTGTCNITKTYTIDYSPTVPAPTVYITNPYTEWCNNDPFTFTATPPAGYPLNFGYDWYATGGISINGSTTTSTTAPTHTSSNSTSVLVGGSVYGQQSIGVRLSNSSCASIYKGFSRKVGPYSNSEFAIIGPSSVCPNQAADFRPSFITSDVWGYQWSAPGGWSHSGQGTPYFSVSVPDPFYGGAITLRLQNRCGWTNTPYVLNLYNSCGFYFTISPNPASETIIVSDLDSGEETSITIVDSKTQSRKSVTGKSSKLELDVKDLPNGLYILQLKQRNVTETQQILIKH